MKSNLHIPHSALGIRRKSVTQRGVEQVKNMTQSPSIEIFHVPSNNEMIVKGDSSQTAMLDAVKIGRHL